VGDRRRQLPEGRHTGDVRELGLRLTQRLLGPLAFGDVIVGFENRREPPVVALLQGPAAGHDDGRPITPCVDELALPAARAGQLDHDVFEWRQEHRPQKVMRHLADSLIGRPAVPIYRTAVPVGDHILRVAHEDGVVCQIEELGLGPQRLFCARSRGDLVVEVLVAPREVRRALADPGVQLIVRALEGIRRASAPHTQPADEQGR
jgi:hypothetical protein